jgi:hypothetical protein
MKIAHPKTNVRKTFVAKLCFDFMAVSVAIEPGICQQVAAEALKYFETSKTHLFQTPSRLSAILTGRESRKNRYMKCKAINARALIRTTHFCLDS